MLLNVKFVRCYELFAEGSTGNIAIEPLLSNAESVVVPWETTLVLAYAKDLTAN